MAKKNKNSDFAKRFIQLANEKKLTVRQITNITGLSVASIHSLKNGALTTDYEALAKFAKHCGCSLDWLLTGQTSTVVGIESVFTGKEEVFDGYLKVKVERMIPSKKTNKED
jgi:transcriptional regulator with XRE-family HTH domain